VARGSRLQWIPSEFEEPTFFVGVFLVTKRKSLRAILWVPAAIALSVFCQTFPANASWFINPERFQASVHGWIPCQICHKDIRRRKLHPNPEDIAKSQMALFKTEDCLGCHRGVMGDLEKGKHGDMEVKKPEAYSKCLRCHDPHTQLAIRGPKSRFSSWTPLYERYGASHKDQTGLALLAAEDEACMACHRTIGSGDKVRIRGICFYCHAQEGTPAQEMTGGKVPSIRPNDYRFTSHADIGCMECHPQAARFNHSEQEPAACTRCHVRHDEKVGHDLHGLVTCGACHLGGIVPVRDSTTKRIVWKMDYSPGEPSRIHNMAVQPGKKSCERCHVQGNRVGAAAMILPSKSVICMPCHSATFSASDTTTLVSILIFLGGMVLMFAYVLTGSASEATRTGGAGKFLIKTLPSLLKAIFLDMLLQRRLYLRSRKRWFIHGLIFYAFLFRFSWGLLALIGSLWNPRSSWVWVMLDKNRALTGFLFDLTGMMLIVGVILGLNRGAERRQTQPADLPRQDRMALLLIGAIVVVGFLLEGMRIHMTGYPPGSLWSFAGYGLGIFCAGLTLNGVYGYVWYLHAVLTGAFVAYIPFSRLAHIILAPVVLAMNAANKQALVEEKRGGEDRRISYG
jgi:nitrate reductase gamma subunit